MTELALLAGAGAVVSLDAVHVAQVMVSRPVVVGPLAGWILGDVVLGLHVGALVELVWISVLPIGPYTPPDATLTGGVFQPQPQPVQPPPPPPPTTTTPEPEPEPPPPTDTSTTTGGPPRDSGF